MRLLLGYKSRSRASWSDGGDEKRFWQGRVPARPNPYFRGKKIAPRPVPWGLKKTSSSAGVVALVIAAGYFFGFSSYFTIQNIEIQSNDERLRATIAHETEEEKYERRFGIFPQQNLLSFSIRSFGSRLRTGESAGYLDELKVEKVFPHTLRVFATKRETGLYLITGALIMDISKDGHLITNLDPAAIPIENFSPTTTAEASFKIVDRPPLGVVPLVYATKELNGIPGTNILPPELAKKLIDLFGRFRQGLGLKIEVMTIAGASPETIEVKVWNGPRFYFPTSDLDASFTRLTALWIQTDAKSRAAIDYIDLRYAERVFVKKK